MSSISVSEARGSMVQAQNVMRLLEKACATLQFNGTIEFQDPTVPGRKDGCVLLFIPSEKDTKPRSLTIFTRDSLFADLYSCIIVRVQEAGGVDKLLIGGANPRTVRQMSASAIADLDNDDDDD